MGANSLGFVDRLRRRDEQAWEELYKVAAPKLLKSVVSRLGSRHSAAAEDVVQDAMERVFSRLDQFRGDSDLYTWIHRIAHNLALKHIRKEKPATKTRDLVNTDGATSSDADVRLIRAEREERLLAALDSLPPRRRAVAKLRIIEGLSLEEIARCTGITIGAVKAHCFAAMEDLKKRMQ